MPALVPAAEWPVDAALVRRLLREQHPDLAHLPLRRIGSGWDSVVHRLGPQLTVRLPRRESGALLLIRELRWLPALAARLPLPVPEPVRAGAPSVTFPHPWSVCRYVPGRPVDDRGLPAGCPPAAPEQLAAFLAALHLPAPPDAPRNPFRGIPLAERADSVQAVLPHVPAGERAALRRLWAEALARAGPGATGTSPPADLWLHGDLHGRNVLAARGRITGIIDFGDLCAGDPATDLACAWLVLDGAGRARLREAYAGPADRWDRARGWAVLLAVMFLAHSADDPVNAAIGRRALGQLQDGAERV